MGVYINMEMPKNCYKCPFLDYEEGFCFASGVKHESGWYESTLCPGGIKDKRHEDCPLIHVPPHGDLIGREWLIDIALHLINTAKNDDIANGVKWLWRYIIEAPTIIPAEEGDDG